MTKNNVWRVAKKNLVPKRNKNINAMKEIRKKKHGKLPGCINRMDLFRKVCDTFGKPQYLLVTNDATIQIFLILCCISNNWYAEVLNIYGALLC